MTPADFATFSNNAVMFASIVYVLAFVAHVTEWATARSDAVAPAEERELARRPEPRAAPRDRSTTFEAGSPAAAPEDRAERWGRIGLSLTVVATVLHLVALVTRGLGADPVRVPWGNMYEFTLAGAFGVSLMYLLLGRRYDLRWMGLPVTGFEVVVLMLAGLLLYVPAGPLVPALHSYWLVIHVAAAVIASGAFAVGTIAAVLYLVKHRAAGTRLDPPRWLPRPAPGPARPGPAVLPAARVRLPDLDVRRPGRGSHLGGVRLGPLLELGPQGGLGVHHLGGLRGLPARPRDCRLAGQGGRHHRDRRVRHPGVQLRRDQLLLRRRQPALLLRLTPER